MSHLRFLKAKDDVRKAPFFLHDGVVIAVKDNSLDPSNNDTFTIDYDHRVKDALHASIASKRSERKRRQADNIERYHSKSTTEKGISIHVPDYSSFPPFPSVPSKTNNL